jgi:hypothetical protein
LETKQETKMEEEDDSEEEGDGRMGDRIFEEEG